MEMPPLSRPRSPRESGQLPRIPLLSDELEYDQVKPKRTWDWFVIFPWLLSIVLAILLVQERRKAIPTSDCFWKPYELEGARREIPPAWKEVKFTGGLRLADGGLIREIDPTQPAYVGPPSIEIDAHWDHLIFPLNLFVTLDEAAVMGEDGMIVEPESGLYIAMPQGLHDLHCLNFLRKALYVDHYPELNTSTLQIHTEHCIDALRQSLMCTSDMTIIREFWSSKDKRILANFDNVHMCRDFDAVRQWSNGRNGEDADVWPQIAERLRGKKPQ